MVNCSEAATDPKQPFAKSDLAMNFLTKLTLILVFLSSLVSAEPPPYAEYDPVLLAVTITDFGSTGRLDGDAVWYFYDADVDYVIAGNFAEKSVRFYHLDVMRLGRMFPAQFVTLLDMEDTDLGKALEIKYRAIEMDKAERMACFSFDPAELFPGNSRFDETVPAPKSTVGTCYESKSLLADISD